ncbi:MAG TPA: PEP-CTERM sorting domain-containing protein [Tepidisphaeraceae bacterium]|jgi:hypothetical protein
MFKHVFACAFAAAASLATVAPAAVIYSTPGAAYTQNFDTLPNTPENVSLGNSPTGWIDDTATPSTGNFSIPGWYVFHPASLTEGGANAHQRMRIGAGSSNTGSFWSYGTSTSTDRALGSLVSGTTVTTTPGQQYIAMRLTNSVGYTLDSFTLSYDGEQWRDGGNATPAAKTVTVEWSTTASAINDSAAYTAAGSAFDFTSTVNGTAASSGFGNTTGKVSVTGGTISGINWLPGTDLWIRWKDPRLSGNNAGMAIDNVSLSAVPEPASLGLIAAAATLLGRRRRSR